MSKFANFSKDKKDLRKSVLNNHPLKDEGRVSGIGKLFFKSPIGDFHCGLRGFNRESILRLDLHTTGMEFASEMVVNS